MKWYLNKHVVITGGSSGIGKATAIFCIQAGAHVCIIGRNESRLTAATDELRKHVKNTDQKIIHCVIDVSNREQVNKNVPEIIRQLGGIDILINSAGIAQPGYIDAIPDTIWDSIMQIDYMGTVNMVRGCLPFFKEQKHGAIANVSSSLGFMGVFGYAAYAPAKFAVVGFSECLRQELLPYNVTVSVIYPPDTDTPQLQEEKKFRPLETSTLTATRKALSPEKVAFTMLKGISLRKFTIVPGVMNWLTWLTKRYLPFIVWMVISRDLKKVIRCE
jgi:3-dehydrosphinganine reductase